MNVFGKFKRLKKVNGWIKNKMGLNVLSLFDGISCGQVALERAKIKINNYYSSEIDKYAIKVTTINYPKTIQIGDITKIDNKYLKKLQIDLLIGGSPCQGFSEAGKKMNFEDDRSKLFWHFVRILNSIKPKYFLFENVNMKEEWQEIISKALRVKPIFINSKLVSAQERKRLYWTNIPINKLPKNKNIKFKDICEDKGFCGAMRGRRIDENNKRKDYNKEIPIKQYIECRKDEKTNCLTTVQKDNVVVKKKLPRQPIKEIEYRWLTPLEYEKLQNLPEEYTKSISDNQRRKAIGNGWTIDIITHIFKGLKRTQEVQKR